MDSKHTAFPFQWILPLGQLVLCLLILWPDRFYVIGELGGPRLIENLYKMQRSRQPVHVTRPDSSEASSTKSDSANTTEDSINIVLPPDAEMEQQLRRTDMRLSATASLNFPMMWVELPFAALSPSKRE